jgi:ABC-type bacteriocin/lantibiotic exporter with double-glycine peptidase domain
MAQAHPMDSLLPEGEERALSSATVALLVHLARDAGTDFRSQDAVASMASSAGQEPLERLRLAATEVGLEASLYRLSIADAVWLADDSLPLVAWSARRQAWLALTRRGMLSARVWTSDLAEELPRAMSRRAIVEFLGAPGAEEPIDLALVRPALPADGLRAGDGHDASGHGDHHDGSPLARMAGLMRPEMPEVWSIVAFSAVTGLLYLALPLAVNAFVSNLSFGAASGPFIQALLAIAGVLFICLAIGAGLRAVQYVVVEVVQRRVFVRVAADLAHRLPNVDLASLDRVHAPELVNRFLEVITIQKSASMILLTGINVVLGAAIGLTVLAFYHPFLLAFSAVLILAMAAIVFIGGRGALSTSIRESVRKYQVVDWLEELARYPKLFKGPGGAGLALSRTDDLARGYLLARRAHFRILIRQIVSLLALEALAATALLVGGGWLVLNQQLTLGQLVAAEIIVGALVASIASLGKQFESWYDAVAAVDKLGLLSDLRLERSGGESPRASAGGMAVDVHEVTRPRPDGSAGLSAFSMRAAPGERIAILGARGSGTTTLLEVVGGMRRPEEGHVSLDGVDLRSWDLRALHERSMLLSANDLFGGTIADNLRMGRGWVSAADLQAALDRVGVGADVRAMHEGVESTILTGGQPLSGRQRAKLVLARALLVRPSLLLVDQLLDGLDDQARAQLAEILTDPQMPWTAIVTTRDPRVAAKFQRMIDLDAAKGGSPRG